MNTVLNTGLAGCAENFAPDRTALLKAGFSVRAVFDPLRSSAEKVAAELALPAKAARESFEELIAYSGLNVIVISERSLCNAECIRAALAAGKHVISEIPDEFSSDHAEMITEAEKLAGRRVAFTSSRLRCAGYTDVARKYMAAGRVGRVYRVELIYHCSKGDPSTRSGNPISPDALCLLDQALDLLQWPQLKTVRAHRFVNPDAEQSGNALIYARMEGDIAFSADFAASPFLPARHSLNILGDKGGILVDHSEKGRGFSLIEEVPGMRAKLSETKLLFAQEPWGTVFPRFREFLMNSAEHPGTTVEQARQLDAWREMVRNSAEMNLELSASTGSFALARA